MAGRIPIWLVTGYLGAGKTTLLERWLREPGLARAALIVNELGEVGLDERLLERAVDSAALLANACVCCTGLPGLTEALTDLWWDRLHRRRPAFDAVVIETTGLADPGPVIETLRQASFLAEHYMLSGVITAVSAVAGQDLLQAHAEALSQARAADVLILTKSDRAETGPLSAALAQTCPGVPQHRSAQASLSWAQVEASLMPRTTPAMASLLSEAAHGHGHAHGHDHAHATEAEFLPGPSGLDRAGLQAWAETRCGPGLQRLKGVLQSADGQLYMAQWAPGDEAVRLIAFEGPVPRQGLTRIASVPPSSELAP